MQKLTKRQITLAVLGYARRHGYYARTVRTMTMLYQGAVAEYRRDCVKVAWERKGGI